MVTVGTYTYSGLAQGPSAVTGNSGSGTVTWSYVGTGSTTYTASATRPTNAGTYTATANVAANGNYAAASSSATAFTIGTATPTIVVTVGTYTYSGLAQGPSAVTGNSGSGTVTWSYVGTGSTTYTASATKPTNAGTYTATASVAANGNYGSASSSATAFTIGTATITVTANTATHVYGSTLTPGSGATPLSVTGMKNSETLTGTVTLAYTSGNTATSAVGTYTGAVSPSAFVKTSGTATVSNYTFTYVTNSLSVTAATITVTANTATHVYGSTLTPGSGATPLSVTGMKNSETLTGTVTLAYTSGNTTTSAVGTFSGAVSPSAFVKTSGTATVGNYTFTYVTNSLSVTAKGLTITANNGSKTYGQTFTTGAGSANFTSSGLVNSQTIGSITIASTGATATAAAGTYPIVPSAATGGTFTASNYTITYTSGTLTVIGMVPPGNTLNFDGANDYVTANPGVYFNGNLTIEAWVNVNSNVGSYSRIMDYANGGLNDNVYLSINSGIPNFVVANGTTQSSGLSAGNTLTINKWNHIAVTLSGTTASIYVNGVLENSASNFLVPTTITRNNCSIGKSNWSGGNYDLLNGSMDELRIWNVTRTQSEIQAAMYSELAGTETGLLAYYNFNQGTAGGTNTVTTLTDLTTNANNGTLNNFLLTGNTSNWLESYAMVVPTATAATNIGTASFTANWTAPVTGTVTNYLLDVSTVSSFASFVSGYNGLSLSSSTTSQSVTGLSGNTVYYYRVRADKTSVTGQGGYSSKITVATTNSGGTLSVGDFYQGGIIYYVTNTVPQTGLVVSLGGLNTSSQIDCYSNQIANGSSAYQAINVCIAYNNNATAGSYGWHLPTISELETLYNVRNSLPGLYCQFYNDNYWSSTQDGSNYKSVQFDGGAVSSWSASNNFRVWAVHAF